MKTETYDLEFITPCFCAGANQAVAEIRVPSIRGELRWWFRALGGNRRDEARLFGSAAHDTGVSSCIRLVISDIVKPAEAWTLPQFKRNAPESYVWYYAQVSGTTGKGAAGPRWQPQGQGVIPPRTTFKLRLTWLRALNELQHAFDETLSAFLALGAIGLRTTRGLGAFHCKQIPDLNAVISTLEKKSFVIKRRTAPTDFGNYESALKDWAAWLRYRLRRDCKAAKPSPLGSSTPRQTSAIRFRPIKTSNGRISWLAYEAPADRVLGKKSRHLGRLLQRYDFSGKAPQPPARSHQRY
ncbi:MAG: type III-B CRISPR module RAMP protein Cmr1 [Verrucomicrobia bacterium]|jgi:hypothetical protein|nr:type III-B CRISPR module RAMP protein Cmr1 [Verrucomicrobiota bacterium]